MAKQKGSICAVFGCYNYKQQPGESKSFFRMPKKPELLKTWITACKRHDLEILLKSKNPGYFYNNYVICSDHFKIQCFRNKNLFSQGLLPDSVPTLFNVEERTNEHELQTEIIEERTNEHELQTETVEERTNKHELQTEIVEEKTNEHELTAKKSRLNEKTNEDEELQFANVVLNDSLSNTGIISVVKSVQYENEKLKQMIKEYRLKLKSKATILWIYKQRNKLLRQKLLESKKLRSTCTAANVMHPAMTTVSRQFFDSQIKLSGRKKKGRRYDDNIKEFALALYYCSTTSYIILQGHFCLNSISSLRAWLNNMHVTVGLNNMVLELLKKKCNKLMSREKIVSVVFDEMSLQEHVTYDSSRDTLEGFENYGDNHSRTLQSCNSAMAVMVKGIYLIFKQVIGYYLSKDAISGDILKDILMNISKKIFDTGFIIKVIVCDLGTNNAILRKLLKVTVDKPYIHI